MMQSHFHISLAPQQFVNSKFFFKHELDVIRTADFNNMLQKRIVRVPIITSILTGSRGLECSFDLFINFFISCELHRYHPFPFIISASDDLGGLRNNSRPNGTIDLSIFIHNDNSQDFTVLVSLLCRWFGVY